MPSASNGNWAGSGGWGCEYVARKPTTQPIASVEHIGESSGVIKPAHQHPRKIFFVFSTSPVSRSCSIELLFVRCYFYSHHCWFSSPALTAERIDSISCRGQTLQEVPHD